MTWLAGGNIFRPGDFVKIANLKEWDYWHPKSPGKYFGYGKVVKLGRRPGTIHVAFQSHVIRTYGSEWFDPV